MCGIPLWILLGGFVLRCKMKLFVLSAWYFRYFHVTSQLTKEVWGNVIGFHITEVYCFPLHIHTVN